MTGTPALDFLLALVALGLLYLAGLLLVDRVKQYRGGEGLSILDDRPGTDEQFGQWNREDR